MDPRFEKLSRLIGKALAKRWLEVLAQRPAKKAAARRSPSRQPREETSRSRAQR
jgi:hypothetical protein